MSLYSAVTSGIDAIASKGGDFAKNTGNNILDALSGGAKGFFLIPSFRAGKKMTEDKLESAQADVQKEVLKAAKDKLDANLSATSSVTSMNATDIKSSDFFTYEVQYNPSTINIRSMSGARKQKKFGVQGETGYDKFDMPTFTDFSFTIIFEAINNSDAFLFPSEFNLLSSDNISTISNAANKIAGGLDTDGSFENPYSVRRNVQGFVALMTRTGWRDVTFFYGQNCFHGKLISVSPRYKMFNKSGEPIYAEVDITIRQSTDSEVDNKIWEDSFLKVVNYKED